MYNYRCMFTFGFITVCVLFFGISAQTETDNEVGNVTDYSETSVATSTVKPIPNISCEAHNNDCKACVERSQCYYCATTDKCHFHIARDIIDGQCDVTQTYFLTCKTNFKIMMIIIGVLTAVPLLIILILCCYCCCKKRGVKLSKDDIKWARQREERKQIAAERRKERAERTEEIRKKYGLVKDSNPYQRFDA